MRETAEASAAAARPVEVSGLSLGRFVLLFAALLAVAAVPVLVSRDLPLFDYPNHLARLHVLAAWSDSADLQRFYAVAWRPLPNLAMDLLVPPLAPVLPLAWAGKAFVLITLFLLAAGAALLHRVLFGTWSAWSCLAFLLLYSRVLLWGFLNYLFGLGLGLIAFAVWVALARRPAGLRLAVASIFALAVFFAHLLAYGLLAVLMLGHAAGRALQRRGSPRRAVGEFLIAVAALVPALAVLALATPGSAGGTIGFGHFARKLDLLFSVFDNYNRPFDIAGFVLVIAALAVAFWRGWVRIETSMALPLTLLTLVYLAMPSRLATAYGADHRLPLLLGLVVVAASGWRRGARGQRLFLSAALALFLARIAVVTASWQASDRVYGPALAALDHLPEGSRLAVAYPVEALHSQPTPLTHFPTLAVARRDAFVPTLFAFPTQQPITLRPGYRALADRLSPQRLWNAFAGDGPALDQSESDALGAYYHIVFVGRAPFVPPTTPTLAPVFLAPRFALYSITQHKSGLDGSGSGR
jgi:hypothetical protein